VGETYEKRARQKRKAQKRRQKAEQKRNKEPVEGETEEDVAARYLDKPEEDEQE